MAMDMTARWALPLLFPGQAQKELFHNEAMVLIDALLYGQVESADIATPPGAPAIGQCWIVASGASGTWAERAGQIACWTEGGWRFVAPRPGLTIRVADRQHDMAYTGSSWNDGPLRADGLYVAGSKVVGERAEAITVPAGGTTVDTESRSAIAAILAALRAHGLIAS